MFIELIGAYISHSIAILTDAFHLFSDLLGFMISLFSIYLSEKYSPKRTFGNGRAEILGALGSIIIIWVLTFLIFVEATKRMILILRHEHVYLNPSIMVILAFSSLFMNLIMIYVLGVEEVEDFSEQMKKKDSKIEEEMRIISETNTETAM